MKQIDLDDLPPRAAKALASLAADEALTLVQGGVVIGRLIALPAASTPSSGEPPDEAAMAEVMDHFNTIINDEF